MDSTPRAEPYSSLCLLTLEEHSRPAAQCFLEALKRAKQQLSQFPNSGAPGSLPGTRRLIVGNYIVSYRRRESDVEIFAVRHSHPEGCTGTDNTLTC